MLYAAPKRGGEAAFGPARVDLAQGADVEAAGQFDHVAQRVHEADIDAQGVRVLDDQRKVRVLQRYQELRQPVGGLFPRQLACRSGCEHRR